MSLINQAKTFVITAGSPQSGWGEIGAKENIHYYKLESDGAVTLTTDWEITVVDTPKVNTIVQIYYSGNVTLGSYNITILGQNLTQYQANKKNIIYGRYTGSAWEVYLVEDWGEVPPQGIEGTTITTLTGSAKTIELDPNVDTKYQIIDGDVVLSGNVIVTSSVTPADGNEFWIKFEATANIDGNVITIFDNILSSAQALSGNVLVYAKYSTKDNAWHSTVISNGSSVGESGVAVDDLTIENNTEGKLASKIFGRGSAGGVENYNSVTETTGINAFSYGTRTKASGDNSVAFGESISGIVEASGTCSFAGGKATGAFNLKSTGIGAFTWGIALARTSTNSGQGSAMFGQDNVITGDYGFCSGSYNAVQANYGAITGGYGHVINALYGGVLGGHSNIVDHADSVILGGTGITTRNTNTAYTEYLDFKNIASSRVDRVKATATYATQVATALLTEVAIFGIPLDRFAACSDITNNNASNTAHGLCPKLIDDLTKFLCSDGVWRVPSTSGTGEVNTASNLGAGEGIYASKVIADLQFKSLKVAGELSIASTGTEITITAPDFGTGSGDIPEIATTLGNTKVVQTDSTGKLVTQDMLSGFNLALGTTTGTVAEGHTHDYAASTHAATHILGGGDVINADKLEIDHVPVNYTVLQEGSIADNNKHLTSHLNGIDLRLGKDGYDIVVVADTEYTVTFAAAYPDAKYSLIVNCFDAAGNFVIHQRTEKTLNGFKIIPSASGKFDYQTKYVG